MAPGAFRRGSGCPSPDRAAAQGLANGISARNHRTRRHAHHHEGPRAALIRRQRRTVPAGHLEQARTLRDRDLTRPVSAAVSATTTRRESPRTKETQRLADAGASVSTSRHGIRMVSSGRAASTCCNAATSCPGAAFMLAPSLRRRACGRHAAACLPGSACPIRWHGSSPVCCAPDCPGGRLLPSQRPGVDRRRRGVALRAAAIEQPADDREHHQATHWLRCQASQRQK